MVLLILKFLKNDGKVKKLVLKIHNKLGFQFAVKLFIAIQMDLLLAAFVNFRNFLLLKFIGIFSCFLTVLTLSFYIVFIFIFNRNLNFVQKTQTKLLKIAKNLKNSTNGNF